MSDKIIIENWGRLPYRQAWSRQKDYFNALIKNPDAQERLIFVEHDPVYTLGFHANEHNIIAQEKILSDIGAECIRIERGGDVTYHGPGQLVVYPIINLSNHGLGVKKYIELLENSVIKLLSVYGITATSNNEAIGVWIDWNYQNARKICAIGVKISRGITMHGLALNVNTDLRAFNFINPCGFTDKGVTSMYNEIGYKVDFKEVTQILSDILCNAFSR